MKFGRLILITVLSLAAATSHPAQTRGEEKKPAARTNGIFFALSVADVDALSKWYQDKLGFEVVSSGEAPNKIAKFAILRAAAAAGGGALVEMVQHREARPMSVAAPGVRSAHQIHGIFKVGMLVGDIDAMYRELKKKQVPIAYELGLARESRMRSFSIRDGEGNLVQFFGK